MTTDVGRCVPPGHPPSPGVFRWRCCRCDNSTAEGSLLLWPWSRDKASASDPTAGTPAFFWFDFNNFILGVLVALPLELSDLGDHKSKLHLLLRCKIPTLGFSGKSKAYRARAWEQRRQLLLQNRNFAEMKLGWMLSLLGMRRCHSDAALALQNRRTCRFSSAKMYGTASRTVSSPVCKFKCTFKIKAFSFK